MGDGKVLEKMGERRKYVRRDATVERLSAIFLEDMVGSVKPSTLACYRRNIQCHILPALGECVAAELTAEEINDYIQQLQEDYSPKLVREIGGLLLRIVGMAGVGYGQWIKATWKPTLAMMIAAIPIIIILSAMNIGPF